MDMTYSRLTEEKGQGERWRGVGKDIKGEESNTVEGKEMERREIEGR